jgi:glycerate kinase
MFGVGSIDRQTLKNHVVALAKAAKVFKVILVAINNYLFSGIAQQCGCVQ